MHRTVVQGMRARVCLQSQSFPWLAALEGRGLPWPPLQPEPATPGGPVKSRKAHLYVHLHAVL